MSPSWPVLRLVLVRVLQSTVGILIVVVGDAGVPVVAVAMIGAGVMLGLGRVGFRGAAHRHAAITGLFLAGATVSHTLAVLNAPVASVETVVQAGALLPLVADRVQRRRPVVVALVVACVTTGGMFVGFAGGSMLGLTLAATAGACAATLVMRLANPPVALSHGQYQAVSITVGGIALLPFGLLLGGTTVDQPTLLVAGALIAIFAYTNLELARVVPATGAVIAMSSSGLRPIVALFFAALAVDQRITVSAIILGGAYAAALTALVHASRPRARPAAPVLAQPTGAPS